MTIPDKPDRVPHQPARERLTRRRRWLGGAGVVGIGAIVSAAVIMRHYGNEQPGESTLVSQEPNAAVTDARWNLDEFVGSQSCSQCHPEIAATFSKHPMAHSMASVADASPIGAITADRNEFEAFGCRYRVERDDDRLMHVESMTDAADQSIYEQAVEVHYAVGSGTTARTYLIDRGGILFESPITWYVGSQQWDLSPGYDVAHHKRFHRRVSDGCVQCHSGRAVPVRDGNSNRFADPPFREPGIGCENCHGPGRRHVERMDSSDTSGDTLIVNPARLDAHLATSVCYQCHLEGKRRILRKGRSFHDFRPGMATEDLWTVFASQRSIDSDGVTTFTSQAEQMHSSVCFRASAGRMSCTSCHDPHRVPDRDDRAAFYRERCNNCHEDRGCGLPLEERRPAPAFNSCIHCHMPTSGSGDIPHAAQSDHRLLKDPRSNPSDADPSRSQPNPHQAWVIFDDSEQRLPEWELQRARALALCEQAIEDLDQQRVEQAVSALETVLADGSEDVAVLRSLGVLYGVQRREADAINAFMAALKLDQHDEVSLKNLGLMAYRSRSYELGLRSYVSYLELNPWDPTMYGPYATMLAVSGNVPTAVNAIERGLWLDPTDRELRRIAVQLYRQIGDEQRSLDHAQTLQAISTRLERWDQQRRDRLLKQSPPDLQRD